MQAVAAYALLPTFAGHGSPLGFEAAGGADFLDTGHSLFFRLSVMVTTQILGSEMVLRTWPPTVAFSVAVCALLAGTVTERAYFFMLLAKIAKISNNACRHTFLQILSGERAWAARKEIVGYAKNEMTGHGFRAMATSLLSEQGWGTDAI